MNKLRLFFTISLLVFLNSCALFQKDYVQFDETLNCPEQTTANLLAAQNQLGYLSKTDTLACTLTALRKTEDVTLRRSAFASRLCLHLAERETDQNKREKLADEGVGFAETALKLGGTGDGEVHYYLAANLGLEVREHITLAINNLARLENELKQAVELSPDLDDSGPLRVLGMLYLKAPAWPNGIGDRDKALDLLVRAVNNHPKHPLNHLFYAQALWDDEGNEATVNRVKAEFAIGEKLLAEGNWGYNKEVWKKEFDEFAKEFGQSESLDK